MRITLSIFLLLQGLLFGAPIHEVTIGTGKGEFANLAAARDHVRTLSKDRPTVVTVLPGIYSFDRLTEFGPKDGGSAKFPITYQAKGQITFDGSTSIPLNSLALANDSKTQARLAPVAHGKVVRIPIKDNTIHRLLANPKPVGTLLMQGKHLLRPSRFPNVGFAHAKKLVVADEGTRFQKKITKGSWKNPNGAVFTLRETPAGSWAQWQQEIKSQQRAVCFGYISAQWHRETMPLHSVDPQNGQIRFLSQTRYGLEEMVHKFQSRQAFLHLICEIDEPGEWYYDPKERSLYLWPTGEITKDSRLAVASSKGFLHLKNTQHLHFKNFTVQGVTSGEIIRISGGNNNTVSGCTLRNSTATAISISGTSNKVHGCDIYDVTRLAGLTGGRANKNEITPGHNEISNCHFYLDKLSGVAPTCGVRGVGNIFRNNLLHNLPGQALIFRGNDHLIERNEFFNIGFEEGDGATIYTGAQFWGYGTQIKHNFLHHIMSTDGLMTRSGIMLDDHDSGREVIENIFYKTGFGSLAVNGGTGHKIHGNVFMKGHYGVWIRIIGNVKQRISNLAKFETGELRRGDKHDYLWRCERVVGQNGWNNTPWTKYPTFAKVMNQPNELRFYPIENDVRNTLGFGMSKGTTYQHPAIPKDKLVFHGTREIDPATIFTDPNNLDFQPKKDVPNWVPKIPFEHIGLYLDDARTSMPDKAKYRLAVLRQFKDRSSCNRHAKYDFDKVNETIYWNSGALLKTFTKKK